MENWEQKYLAERQAHQETAQKGADIIFRLTKKIARLHLWVAGLVLFLVVAAILSSLVYATR